MKRILERRYGFGSARVALRPTPVRRRPVPSLREGWRAMQREEGDVIVRRVSLSLLRASVPAVAALVVSLFLASLLRERQDTSTVEIVAFEEPAPPEAPAPPEEIAEQPPEPEPEPVPAAVPPPPAPKPEIVAARPPEPRARPKPAPEPPPRAPAPEPPRREPVRPPPRIEPVAPPVLAKASPPPEPARAQRSPAPAPAPAHSAPPVAFAAAALPREPALDDAPAPRRTTAFAAARPSDTRPRVDLAAPAPVADLDDLEAPAARGAHLPTVPTPRSPAHSAPALDFAAAALPGAPETPRRDSAARRPVPTAPPPRRRERGNPAALGLPAAPTGDPGPPAAEAPLPRSARAAAPAPSASVHREEPALRGVPLASLDACVSDRQEDALKQRVVAAAEERSRCESAAGRFHFVETKNVNAFLMWIERAPGRKMGDRCAELLHALDCLASAKRSGR